MRVKEMLNMSMDWIQLVQDTDQQVILTFSIKEG